jgi:hypothetical protein
MTNSLSKPIPRKPRQVKAFAKPIIPLWPRATWVPEKKENSAGEKTRSLKLELSTEPGTLNGKTITKSFKIYRAGTPEEWILWRRDFNEVCTGMSVTSGAGRNRMVRQLLSDEPLKEFERKLSTFATETNANCNLALDAVAIQIFPNNAYAKQKKYLRQGMWKPKALTIRNTYTRICELNEQLTSYPNQTGLLPEDEMKSAFINICMPDWQQEFLKTGINEYSSSWEEILSKAEALETAEIAIAELAPAKDDDKRAIEDGEVAPATKPSPKKKAKKSFFCKMHGPDQNHNTDTCKVIMGEIDRLKNEKSQGRKPNFSTQNNNQQSAKPTWTDRKRPATSYSTEQLKEVVRMTRRKAMEDAKSRYESKFQDELNAIEIDESATQEREKMRTMELFINDLVDEPSDMEEEEELTQAELDELAASFSN